MPAKKLSVHRCELILRKHDQAILLDIHLNQVKAGGENINQHVSMGPKRTTLLFNQVNKSSCRQAKAKAPVYVGKHIQQTLPKNSGVCRK